MSEELKPCPCCGTRLQSEDIEHAPGESWGTCPECGLVAEMSWWNTRPREDALEAEVERLRDWIEAFVRGIEGGILDPKLMASEYRRQEAERAGGLRDEYGWI